MIISREYFLVMKQHDLETEIKHCEKMHGNDHDLNIAYEERIVQLRSQLLIVLELINAPLKSEPLKEKFTLWQRIFGNKSNK